MYKANVYKIFLASPSDLFEERKCVQQIISEWNNLHSTSKNIILQAIGWETHSYPSMEGRPQEVLNKQILQDCDFLIGVFWCRIGTPTGGYGSGTIEEIEEHINNEKPAMLCFSKKQINPELIDQAQYNELKEFKKKSLERGLVVEYSTIDEFKKLIYDSLVHRANAGDPFIGFNNNQEDSELYIRTENIPQLNKDEKYLLLEASLDQTGEIMKTTDSDGISFDTNGKHINKDSSPQESARWEWALKTLIDNELVEEQGYEGFLFKVTHNGYKIAERIKNP